MNKASLIVQLVLACLVLYGILWWFRISRREGFDETPTSDLVEGDPQRVPCDGGMVRYYKKLDQMTPNQLMKFKKKAKLKHMTLEDYKNWLSLFIYDQDSLSLEHRENLAKLIDGKPILIVPEDVSDEMAGIIDQLTPATQGYKKVTIEIPDTDVDSPINYRPRSALNTSGEMDVNDRLDPHELEYSGYPGNVDYAKLNRGKLVLQRKSKATDWFNKGSFPWLFDRPESGYITKENRFDNIIRTGNETRHQCCAAKKRKAPSSSSSSSSSSPDQAVRPNFFDDVTPDERVFGPRTTTGNVSTTNLTGLGQGSSNQGATVTTVDSSRRQPAHHLQTCGFGAPIDHIGL